MLGLLLAASPIPAMEASSELEATREALRTLEREQQQRLREIDRLEERIAEVARRNLQLRREQREMQGAIASQDRDVADLQTEVEGRSRQLELARTQAASLLRGQWLRQRHQGGLQPRNPELRHQRAFDARLQARSEQALASIATQVADLSAARDRLTTARALLAAREAEISDLLREIERQDQEQRSLLARVQRQAERDALEAERLESNAQTLERMLRRMEKRVRAEARPDAALRDAPAPTPVDESFARMRGLLPKPVNGAFLHRYGSPRTGGPQPQWRGEVFAVGDDSPVQAVHDGTAVYADWMRGLGFLVILDHGGDYLTLYGNNRELFARTGQRVARGDVLARAGGTSPVIGPGLYFELRHQGETLNPAAWWESN
jgi:septal ring factor EnvC (AmiA/AmiB activator)